MAGTQTVWSIDVGKSALKAVKVHRERNHLEIVSVDRINYPVEANGVDALHQAKEAIRTFASRHNVNCPVIVSHPGHAAFSRFIQLPPVDAKKLVEMIGYEAQQQIPFPIAEVRWAYHVCGAASGAEERNVGIFAVRSEVISDFIQDYETTGIPVSMISIGYLGLFNYVMYDVRPEKPSVILDIGSDHTDLLIVDGKRFWVRNLAIAGNDVTQALMEKFKLNFEEAEKLKLSASKSDQAVKIFGVVQPTLKDLVNEIHRSVGFYKSQAGDVRFEDIYLFGNSSRLVGLQKYLQEHLRFQVHIEKGFHRIRVNREANVALLQQDFASFAPCVGHAIQALGEGECQVNLLPQERQEALEFRKKQVMVLGAAVSTYLLLAILYLIYSARADENRELLASAQSTTSFSKNSSAYGKAMEEYEAVDRERRELEKLLVNHLEPLDAMAMLAEAFNKVPNEVIIEAEIDRAKLAEEEGRKRDEQRDANEKKSWLTLARMERVYLGHKGVPLDPRERTSQAHVPGYQVTVHVITNAQDTTAKTQAMVDQNIRAPIEAALTAKFGPFQVADGHRVTLEPVSTPPKLIYSQGRSSVGRREGGVSDETQGELEEFTLTWIQFQGELPAPPEAPAPAGPSKGEKAKGEPAKK